MTASDPSQLSLFLDGEDADQGAAPGPLRPTLVVVRGRGHYWSRARRAGVVVWTFHELLDRVRLLGFLERDDGAVLDDDAALWAAAAVLSRESAFAVRVAADLAQLAQGMVHATVDVEALATRMRGRDGRAGELAALFDDLARVNARLQRAGVVDASLALARGVAALERGRALPALTAFARVVVEDPLDATDLEVRALVALARRGVRLSVRLPHVEGPLAEGLHRIATIFEAAWDAEDLEVQHEPLVGRGDVGRFVDEWYRASLEPPRGAPVRVEILADPFDEARRVAGVVARWRREQGGATPPRVAVALRTVDVQAERIADALVGHGVPVRLSSGPTLADVPAGRLLLDLLRVRRQGAPRELLLAVLSSPALRDAMPSERTGSLARVLRRAVARTDVEDASRPAGGYRHRLERFALGRDDERERARAAEAIVEVERVLAVARRFPLRAPLEQHLAASLEVMLGCSVDDADGGRDRVLELLEGWSRSLARVAPEGCGDVDIAAWWKLLSRALGARRLPPPREPDDSAVEVLPLPELFGREWDLVVIADCQHGRVPLAERRDPLLGDADRALVNKALGARVLHLAEPDVLEPGVVPAQQALEPIWFLGAMAAARRALLLTAPARDRRGREVAPSQFLEEALIALGADPSARAAGPPLDEDPHPRALAVALAQRVVKRRPAEGPPAVIARARLYAEVARQRRRFFERRSDADVLDFASEWAFAVDPEHVRRAFGRDLGLERDKPLGPTRLEALAACRLRGYVEHLLGVDTSPEAGHDADARTLGKLAHRALEVFFRERRDQGVEPSRMTAGDRQRLRDIVAAEAARYLEGGVATGHLGALRANVSWLAQSLVRTVSGLALSPPVAGAVPRYFELKVGTRGYEQTAERLPPVAAVVSGRTLWLGGEIDRVDEGEGRRVVVDYKHSTAGAVYKKLKAENLFVTHFQLPLYLYVLEQGAMQTSDDTRLCGYLVSLRDGVASPVLSDENGVLRRRLFDEQAATGFLRSVGRVLDPLFDGAVPPDEGERCAGCRVRRVCRLPLFEERGLDDVEEGQGT